MNSNNTEQPLVSIVTPVYNGERYLQEAIDSVLAQDYPNIEYIILDDGSTDKTKEILEQYGHRIKWKTQSNMGQSATLNKGWSMCRGSLLSYINADDILFPNAISTLVQVMLENPVAAVVYPNCDLIDQHGKVFNKKVARPFNHLDLILKQQCYIGPGAIFRDNVFKQMGGWRVDLDVANDREFWMRVGLLGDFVMHPETLAYFRIHSNAKSYALSSIKMAEDPIKAITAFYQYDNIPSDILKIKHVAVCNAHVLASRAHFLSKRIRLAVKNLIIAKKINKNLNIPKTLLMILRSGVGRFVRWVTSSCSSYFYRKQHGK